VTFNNTVPNAACHPPLLHKEYIYLSQLPKMIYCE